MIQKTADRALKKLRFTRFRIFNFTFNIVISVNFLVKAQKLQLFYYPDGLMVKLSGSHALPNACIGSNPAWATQTFFFFLDTAIGNGHH